jgi:hypothetical protein
MRRMLVPCAVAAVLAGAATFAIAADAPPAVVDYAATDGSTYAGVRPTAVGLPQIGEHGTVGAGDLANALTAYHDSGAYARDLNAVGAEAKAYLQTRLDQNAAPAQRRCTTRYRRTAKRLRGHRLYRRVRTCSSVTPPRLTGKPAIVLDIDETTLSNYDSLKTFNYTAAGVIAPAVLQTGVGIGPTRDLYAFAKQHGVAVFFVTGRPSAVKSQTEANLRAEGFDNWDGLSFKPSDKTTEVYKAGQRAALEAAGYDVVVNLGDQESDLDGGHADRAFKYPNPFYFIGDA